MLSAALLCLTCFQPLTEAELKKQLAYTTLHFIDYRQTLAIATTEGVKETNPILGPKPSRSTTTAYFATTLAAHWLITYALPPTHREPWQNGTILLELAVTTHNAKLGLTLNF